MSNNDENYLRNIRRRASKYGVHYIDKSVTLSAVYEKFNGVCCSCGCDTVRGLHPQKSNSATVEHITPLREKGQHSWNNVELLCHSCNASRNYTFAKKLKKFRLTIFGFRVVITKLAGQ